jgi:hypothetical protein
MELYGTPFGDDWYDTAELVEKFGPNYSDIFKHALDPEQVQDRELYPFVAAAVTKLYQMGFGIHFMSHNPNPSKMYLPVHMWLDDYIHINYELTIFGARNDKISTMREDPKAWAIIEDKPSTLVKAQKNGYVTLARRHPWNLDVIAKHDIMSFDNWAVVPEMLWSRLQSGREILSVS